jgi:hypothetical protein
VQPLMASSNEPGVNRLHPEMIDKRSAPATLLGKLPSPGYGGGSDCTALVREHRDAPRSAGSRFRFTDPRSPNLQLKFCCVGNNKPLGTLVVISRPPSPLQVALACPFSRRPPPLLSFIQNKHTSLTLPFLGMVTPTFEMRSSLAYGVASSPHPSLCVAAISQPFGYAHPLLSSLPPINPTFVWAAGEIGCVLGWVVVVDYDVPATEGRMAYTRVRPTRHALHRNTVTCDALFIVFLWVCHPLLPLCWKKYLSIDSFSHVPPSLSLARADTHLRMCTRTRTYTRTPTHFL